MGMVMSGGEGWETLFNIISFAMAALAAYLWLKASNIELPPHTGDSWEGRGAFADALKNQSKLNARAALAASVAALFQGLSIGAKLLAIGAPWLLVR
jgi:hypothetical protein